MSDISIKKDNPFSKEDAKTKVEGLRTKISNEMGLQTQWNGDALTFDGKGAKGQLTVSDSHIDINIKLGLFLKPLSGAISSKVEEALDQAIQSA